MKAKHLIYKPNNPYIFISNQEFDLIVHNFILVNNMVDRGKFIYCNFECYLIGDELKLYASSKNNDYIEETYLLNPDKQNLYKIETHYKMGNNEDHNIEFVTKEILSDFINVMLDIAAYKQFCFE